MGKLINQICDGFQNQWLIIYYLSLEPAGPAITVWRLAYVLRRLSVHHSQVR